MTRLSTFKIVVSNMSGTNVSTTISNASSSAIKELKNELLRCIQHGATHIMETDEGTILFPGPVLQNSVISLVKVSDEDR